ncbi:GltA [Streptomyces sp. NPDC048202]|uniref:GltA n=1 Tax=unclassified Streptomyces TaxID=2593676 RepID=UPI003719B7DC
MPTLSVLTPVHDGGYAYLGELGDSLRAQRLPGGWRLQWVVQEDGVTGRPAAQLPDEPWISTGTGRHGGAARARTLGLARVTGALLRCVDADDLLPDADTLARDIEVLSTHPDRAWTVAPCLDLHPDGRLEPGPYDPAPGPLPARTLLDGAARGAMPVVGTTQTVHTELVRLLGGWPALPAFEDGALLLSCEAVSPGWMQSAPGTLYRKHPTQHTASDAFHDRAESRLRVQIAVQRAEALHTAGWRWRPTALKD